MSTEGWIFMVGLRVFDIGALIVWLIWFYRQRDDDSDGDDDRGGGGGPPPHDPSPEAPSGGDFGLPKPDADPWPGRRRDHTGREKLPRDPIPRRPATPARPGERRTPAR
jgi:hypothetical protein